MARTMLAQAKNVEFLVECVDNLAAGLERLSRGGIEAVLLDLTLPDCNGLETFIRLHAVAEDVPTIVYTSVDDEELSLSALNLGAADYLVKSEVNANWLARSLVYAIQRASRSEVTEEVAAPDESVEEATIRIERSADSDVRWIATLGDKRVVSIPSLEQIKGRLLRLLRQSDCEEVCVDMSQVEYVANAAISMLLIVHKRAVAANKCLVLGKMTPHVREQFSSRRFDKVFNIQRA